MHCGSGKPVSEPFRQAAEMRIRRKGKLCEFHARANIVPMSACRLRDRPSSERLSGGRGRSIRRNRTGRSRRGARRTMRSAVCWPVRRSARRPRPPHARLHPGCQPRNSRRSRPGSGSEYRHSGHVSRARFGAGISLMNRLRGRARIVETGAERLLPGSTVSTLCRRWHGASSTPSCSENRWRFADLRRAVETDRPIVLLLVSGKRDAVSQFGVSAAAASPLHLACVSRV